MKKTIIKIILIFIVTWCILCGIDFLRLKDSTNSGKYPIICFSSVQHGGKFAYYEGIGYSVKYYVCEEEECEHEVEGLEFRILGILVYKWKR